MTVQFDTAHHVGTFKEPGVGNYPFASSGDR